LAGGATEHWVEAGSLRIGITGLRMGPREQAMISPLGGTAAQARIRQLVLEGTGRYAAYAPSAGVGPVSISGRGFMGAHATLGSNAGSAGFPVFRGLSYPCVSTGVITTLKTLYVVSIGSWSCFGEEHQSALRALSTIVSEF
jgi:hypothetical protein